MMFRRIILMACAALLIGAPLAAAFAAAQPCATAAAQASPCECDASAASTCALACGIASSGFALMPDAAAWAIQAGGDRVLAEPPVQPASPVSPPGLQPPR